MSRSASSANSNAPSAHASPLPQAEQPHKAITTAQWSTQLTNILEGGLPDEGEMPLPRLRGDVVCDTAETQELLEDFFALYAAPAEAEGADDATATTVHASTGTRRRRESDDLSAPLAFNGKRNGALGQDEGEDGTTGALLSESLSRVPSSFVDGQEEDEESGGGDGGDRDSLEGGDVGDGGDAQDDFGTDSRPAGRTADHHAQQSQYVPVEEAEDDEEGGESGDEGSAHEGEEEEEAVDVDGVSSVLAAAEDNDNSNDEAIDDVCVRNEEEGEQITAKADGNTANERNAVKKAESRQQDLQSKPPHARKVNEEATLKQNDARVQSSSAAASPLTQPPHSTRSNADGTVYWPFAHPPPPHALPSPTQTRAAFHTRRYGAFIKAYLGLSDQEVRQAERRGRGICMIGVRKVVKYSKGMPASPVSYSFSGRRLMPVVKGVSEAEGRAHPFGVVRPSNVEAVRTQRVFLRHSVLAVEGDAVFCQLIDRAEVLYAVEQRRLDDAAAAVAAAAAANVQKREEYEGHVNGVKAEEADGHGVKAAKSPFHSTSAATKAEEEPLMYPQFRKLPRVVEPCLRPNARCIALHYGLPDGVCAAQNVSSETKAKMTSTATSAAQNPFPRATLIAVVSTTRLDDNAEIYVSLDSYYRCLDEVSWYRRCYRHMNARYGCSEQLSATVNTDVKESAEKTPDNILSREPKMPTATEDVGSGGDVYTGVKMFPAWPADLAFYHGVGKRHASTTAQGAFPFTLVDLGAAPELGENQKGVVATSWIPYGTCLLYCGPTVATRKVEKLVSARVLNGQTPSREETSTATAGEKGMEEREDVKKSEVGTSGPTAANETFLGMSVTRHAKPLTDVQVRAERGEEEEDLSFVTDDTYALGLGRHGVCFGQGLTRYINHRYNTSRFGNVELCSVMLSVPSEFSTEATTSSPSRTVPLGPHEQSDEVQGSTGAAARLPCDPSLTADENNRIRSIVKKRSGRSSNGHHAGVAGNTADAVDRASAQPRGKRKAAAPSHRRAPRFYFEEKSLFVTVPFFLATTDIAPGESLLAWTYGEDYDAKLERQAVAEGQIVPYADAAVLNRRLIPRQTLAHTKAAPHQEQQQQGLNQSVPQLISMSSTRRFQRYSGDYRFAVGVGDIVWRRRPLMQAALSLPPQQQQFRYHHQELDGPLSACCCGLIGASGGSGSRHGCNFTPQACLCMQRLLPPPEEDLFLVVQTRRASVEEVLLEPLTRVELSDAALGALLREQHLHTYVSPHVSSDVAVACAARTEDADDCAEHEYDPQQRGHERGQKRKHGSKQPRAEHRSSHDLHSAKACTPAWSQHWAVFELPIPTGSIAPDPSTLPLARAQDALRRCVVATVDTVGLLLADVDYSLVHTPCSTSHLKTSPGGGKRKGGQPRAGLDGLRRVVVNLDDLRHATLLVRTAVDRATAVPPLWNGLLWPLLSAPPLDQSVSGAAVAGSGSRGLPLTRK